VSEQPRSVPPQQLAQTLGRRARRTGNRPIAASQPGAATLSVAPEPADDVEAAAHEAASTMRASMLQLPPPAAVPQDAEVPGSVEPTLASALPEASEAEGVPTSSKSPGVSGTEQTSASSDTSARRPKSARARTSKTSGRSTAATDQLPVAAAVYVPLDVRELVTAHRKATDQTAAEVILRAIESQYARLPELVAALSQPEVGAIFTFAASSKKKETKVQMGLRMTRGQLRALDEVEERVGASSRGQLVTAAVRAELGE
jgi:hypothetical protein